MRRQLERLGGWWLVSVIALIVIGVIAGQQIPVLVFKFLQVVVAVVIGYIADKSLYRFAPPIDFESPRDLVTAARLIARAVIVAAIVLGLAIGV